jgi:hypothetical protein
MAGRGPAPKDPSLRRRTNTPARGEWVTIWPPEKPVLPPLSRLRAPEGGWPSRTRELWEEWRRDAATTQWGPAEMAAARELAYLHAEWVRYGPASLASEIRLRTDSLGLSLKGKRDLRYVVGDPAQRPDTSRARAAAPAPQTREYGHLKAVL